MSKHTPGPWQKDGMVIAGADGTEVCLMGEPAQYAGEIGLLFPNAETNARLIAAAPDMLKALQMEEELNRIGLIRAENDFIEAVNKARRDAIAKAGGPVMSIDWDKPVQTRDGRKARVLCTDRRGDSPVVALIDFPGRELIGFYDEYGRGVPSNADPCADLINVPERTDRVRRTLTAGGDDG